MGNLCTEVENQSTVNVNPSERQSKLKSSMQDSEQNTISEIKEFLTLTSQNSCSFYEFQEEATIMSLKKRNTEITDFKVIRGLGKGAFGQVFMVRHTTENKFYAMKVIVKAKVNCPEQRLHTLSERYILEAMSHPFIVQLHYAFQTGKKLYLLCDLMTGGELFYLLRRNKKFSEEVAKFYAAEILLAIQYLHSRNIIYRDIKPENILLDATGHVKITDFGLSKVCHSHQQLVYSICGTPQYIAPEVLNGKGYLQCADWFSFGSLLYDMLTGKPPFYSTDKQDMMKKIGSKPVPLPDTLSASAKSLLKALFKIKPKDRLGFERDAAEIKEHEFFASINFEDLLKKKIEPPITFKEALNIEGFDAEFQYNSVESTMNLEHPAFDKGFDGFTYYKPDLPSPKKTETLNEARSRQESATTLETNFMLRRDDSKVIRQ